jgi:AcrR family transcriptional regulator
MPTAPSAADRPAPRERLLAAADELFYGEGVCSVGIDKILKRADVARASLYSTFGSKDELVKAYLQGRSAGWQATVDAVLPERWDTPRDRIVGIFVLLTEWFAAPSYHGCPMINASAEAAPGGAVEPVVDTHRAWVRELFAGLAREAGARDPEALAAQLVLLYDGAMAGAQLDHRPEPGEAAQVAAAVLVDAAAGGRRRS